MFGVFINRGGKWSEWTTGAESYVRQECAYLRDCLNLDARVFRKIAK